MPKRIFKRKSPLIRFWPKVEKTNGCWHWIGAKNKDGYGQFYVSQQYQEGAHRFMYEKSFGSIPKGMCVLHRCDNPACVNPDHLFLGTHRDNTQDMINKGRKQTNPPRGSKHHNSILTEDDVINIRSLKILGYTCKELSRKLGLKQRTIRAVVNRENWKHI